MRSFHVILQRYDRLDGCDVEPLDLEGQSMLALQLKPNQLSNPLDVTFDEALERLSKLPRMFTEMDGSFVWVGQEGRRCWQIDGQLHDGASGLMDVELKGCAPRPSWRQLLSCLRAPDERLVCQLVRTGIYVDPAQFERLIWPETAGRAWPRGDLP